MLFSRRSGPRKVNGKARAEDNSSSFRAKQNNKSNREPKKMSKKSRHGGSSRIN
jgi:hypothetical protein